MIPQTYRFTVGNLDCIAVDDYSFQAPAQRFFSNVSDIDLRREMRTRTMDISAVRASSMCLAVRTEQGWVLFDTGHGAAYSKAGYLVHGLQEQGVQPEDIASVVLSHTHIDHIGGLLDAQGNLVFKNANYFIGRVEWEYAATERGLEEIREQSQERARQLRRYLHPLQPRLRLVDDNEEFLPGMTAYHTPGHSPGQIVVRIASEGEVLLYSSDVVVHPLHVENPEWDYYTDGNPRVARQTRAEFLQCAVIEHALVLAYHFPFPGLGHIGGCRGQGYRFEALSVVGM